MHLRAIISCKTRYICPTKLGGWGVGTSMMGSRPWNRFLPASCLITSSNRLFHMHVSQTCRRTCLSEELSLQKPTNPSVYSIAFITRSVRLYSSTSGGLLSLLTSTGKTGYFRGRFFLYLPVFRLSAGIFFSSTALSAQGHHIKSPHTCLK